jgi:hypothetical protein
VVAERTTYLMSRQKLCLRDISYVSTLLLLSMRTRTTFGAYHMTYVAYLHNFRCVPLDLCLDLCLKVITRNMRYTLPNWCITHSLCRGLLYYRTRRDTSYVVPYKLMLYRDTTYVVRSRTATQLMLLGHDRTISVICNITYDAMSLIATYVRYLCCNAT